MELLENVNFGLLIPILIVQLILLVIALINVIKADNTNGPKWVWVLIIVFINIIGPIVYFVFGRRDD
ncbi:PLDc_N domain-containing protein [Bacillus sp. DNRA2]|uniref:PLDc N-terminal domain-containing protein n=1 Tax=Bacillus sp. DNRA2 TaxID=2723053 RepID=UPI00145F5AD4|nr:PLD nuclease N-terminal domain-containing protein [Bacillus sp. DNRA2]NMD69989.1 PLDc_N domain-containing protein [Bacillus sp. DNRA2]